MPGIPRPTFFLCPLAFRLQIRKGYIGTYLKKKTKNSGGEPLKPHATRYSHPDQAAASPPAPAAARLSFSRAEAFFALGVLPASA